MTILPVNNTLLNSVTYVLYSEDVDYCILIDCGEWETLQPILARIGKSVKAVLLSHGHLDHIHGLIGLYKGCSSVGVYTTVYGIEELQNPKLNLSLYHGCPFSVEGYTHRLIKDGDTLTFDGLAEIEVIATPGHTPSSITYRIGKNLFTGDAYIPRVKTFTKFPRGNKEQALKSIVLLNELESQGYKIYCGHHSY